MLLIGLLIGLFSIFNTTTVLLFCGVLLLTYCFVDWKKQRKYPPGPRGLPFIGNPLRLGRLKQKLNLFLLLEAHENLS